MADMIQWPKLLIILNAGYNAGQEKVYNSIYNSWIQVSLH